MSIKKTREAKKLIEAMAPQGEFLAFINNREAKMLKDAGGSGIMTPIGIPSFIEYDDDSGSGFAGATAGGEYGGGSPDDTFGGGDSPNIVDEVALTKPKRSFFRTIADSIRGISKFSPTSIVTRGLGNLFNNLRNLRGFNPDGTRRTQAQFERARDIRRAEKSIANIMGRDAPFTALTLDRLADLYSVLGQDLPSNINESLIGTTNVTRSGTADDVFPDRVEGIVTQAPQTFREAMAALNLTRGVPRDQVFLSAKDFIDPAKTIGSEDLGTIQSRMARSAGVPESAIQLTKTFNTPEELENLGVLEDALFGGKKLTDQGKVLEDFRRQATKMRDAEMGPTYQQGVGSQLNRMLGMPGLMGDIIENKDFIQSAIDKGFLSEPSDFQNQKPFEDIL